MPDQLIDEIRAFLADLGVDLTNLHVKAMQYMNAPTDQATVEALSKLPAGLLDRAQDLAARIDEHRGDAEPEAAPAPAPKAKPAAAPAKKSARRARS